MGLGVTFWKKCKEVSDMLFPTKRAYGDHTADSDADSPDVEMGE